MIRDNDCKEILAAIAKARKIDAEGHGYDAMVEAVDTIEAILKRAEARDADVKQ